MGYILAIDQGTTGTTAVLMDDSSYKFIGKINKEFPQIFPKPGWVEHDLNDIWKTVEETVSEVIKRNSISPEDITGIGITNQRETTCAFGKDGTPLRNAIVWQDRRTGDYCQKIRDEGRSEFITKKTGLPVDPYFSGTKIHWMLNNSDEVKNAHKNDNLLFGTIDTFLLYKLSGHSAFATEGSNASRTLLMNLQTCDWDKELLSLFGVDRKCLPEIKESFGSFGKTKGLGFLPDGIPISGMLGDQQSALFGQAGFGKGSMKCTYGTGAFILLNTGTDIVWSKSGLLSTVAFNYEGKNHYAVEGSAYIAGAAVQWLRDNLKFFDDSPKIEALASSVTNLDEMEHVLFMPFFTGIGSPYWKSEAKGALIGLTRDTGQAHIARACLEGIALSINDLIKAMRNDTGLSVDELKVDGGAVANNLLMKIQSTISNLKIIRPQIIETTAYGAALGAAIGIGKINFNEIEKLWGMDKEFDPDKSSAEFYSKKTKQWNDTIKKLFLA